MPGQEARSEFRKALEAVVHVYHEEWKCEFYKSARRCRRAIEQTAGPERKLRAFRSGFEKLRTNLIRLRESHFRDLLGLPKPVSAFIDEDVIEWVPGLVNEFWSKRAPDFRAGIALVCDGSEDAKRWSAPPSLLKLVLVEETAREAVFTWAEGRLTMEICFSVVI